MLGILTGMKITLKHFFGHKVTRCYPYEKRVLPARSRGLIRYVTDDKGQFKCEGCLLCEKVCPPQAITINTRPRETHRDRPLTLPQATWGNFKRSRRSLFSRQGRPQRSAEEAASGSWPVLDAEGIRAALVDGDGSANLVNALAAACDAIGYLPRNAVASVARETGVDLSTAYGMATAATGFRPAFLGEGSIAVCQCPVCRNAGASDLVSVIQPLLEARGQALSTRPHPRCLGDVMRAPVVVVGDRTLNNAIPETARELAGEFLNAGGSIR